MVGDLFEVRGVDVFAQKRNGELHRYKRVLMLATGFTDPAIADEQRAPHLVRGHVLGDTRDVRTTRRLANSAAKFSQADIGHPARDRKSTRLNSSHSCASRMPSSA